MSLSIDNNYHNLYADVEFWVENGLVEEAKKYLSDNLSSTSSMAIGHKELAPFFNGVHDLDVCLDNLKMQTRRYAKRQLTWFRKDEEINWFNIDTIDSDQLIFETERLIKKVLFNEENQTAFY